MFFTNKGARFPNVDCFTNNVNGKQVTTTVNENGDITTTTVRNGVVTTETVRGNTGHVAGGTGNGPTYVAGGNNNIGNNNISCVFTGTGGVFTGTGGVFTRSDGHETYKSIYALVEVLYQAGLFAGINNVLLAPENSCPSKNSWMDMYAIIFCTCTVINNFFAGLNARTFGEFVHWFECATFSLCGIRCGSLIGRNVAHSTYSNLFIGCHIGLYVLIASKLKKNTPLSNFLRMCTASAAGMCLFIKMPK